MGKLAEISGEKFGRLTALKPLRLEKHQRIWLFQCDCGRTCEKTVTAVRKGNVRSCGCLATESQKQRFRTHGHSANGTRTGTYRSWEAAKRRCFNSNADAYDRYGGRGITMCDEWHRDYSAFFRDMGSRPEGLTLERINNDGNYEPDNCRWATQSEQSSNRHYQPFVKGSLADYARQHGICYSALWSRLKNGQNPKKAVAAMLIRKQRKLSRDSKDRAPASLSKVAS